MLPLLQNRRQTVPTTNFDSFPNQEHRQAIHDSQLLQQNTPSHDRSFPIRTLQSYSRMSENSPYGLHPSHRTHEHQLRRKTPGGTIDAGYDGSSAKSSIGEPPFKQLVLPGHPINVLEYQFPGRQLYKQGPVGIDGATHLPTCSWQSPAYIVTPPPSHNGPYQPGSHPVGPNFASIYQPVIRANEYNVRAFCPPPLTLVGGLPLGQPGWQHGPSPWENPSVRDPSTIPRGGYAPRPEFAVIPAASRLIPVADPLADYNTQNSEPDTQSTYAARQDIYQSLPDFKFKAISQAYCCYASLVGYLQASSRVSINKDSSGADPTSSRHLIFPKPPRPKRERPVAGLNLRQAGASNSRSAARIFASRVSNSIGMQSQHFTHVQQPSRHVIFAGIDQFRAEQCVTSRPIASTSSNINVARSGMTSANDARTSIGILKNLCEQSQWTWIEGILVLGCLLYALEQYTDALQCFSRITALDPRYFQGHYSLSRHLYLTNTLVI